EADTWPPARRPSPRSVTPRAPPSPSARCQAVVLSSCSSVCSSLHLGADSTLAPGPNLGVRFSRATGRQRPITITPRHITAILVGTPITSATTPRRFHAPGDDVL